MISIFKKRIKRIPITKFDNIDKMPEAVFFDYDGTICDNSKYLVKAFNYALKTNFNKKKDKNLLTAIKKIKKDSEKWAYIKQNCPIELFEKCNQDYDFYISSQKLRLIPYALKTIKLFNKYNIPLFIISQKYGDGLRNELKKAGILQYFKNAYGTLDFGELQKPTKEYMEAVKKKTGTKNKHCWMIGDRNSDVVAALNMNSNAFIINKEEVEIIRNNYNDLIGKQIFFTSYKRLCTFIKKQFKFITKRNNTNKKNI